MNKAQRIRVRISGVGAQCDRFRPRPAIVPERLTVVVMVIMLLTPYATCPAQESRNKLPKKQHRNSDAPFLQPDEAVQKMAIPDGFEVSVFASEPDIAEPIAFLLRPQRSALGRRELQLSDASAAHRRSGQSNPDSGRHRWRWGLRCEENVY